MVGLGNPGAQYANTRHNVGFEVIEILASRHGGKLRKSKERALVDEVCIEDKRVALAAPQTFMNNSGESVAPLVRRYGIDDPARLVVVHDELDLPPGRVKVKVGGGLAGHNGLRSIKAHLHTTEFTRVRIGVGKPVSRERGVDHVLSKISRSQREVLDAAVALAVEAVEIIAAEGAEAAMGAVNSHGVGSAEGRAGPG